MWKIEHLPRYMKANDILRDNAEFQFLTHRSGARTTLETGVYGFSQTVLLNTAAGPT